MKRIFTGQFTKGLLRAIAYYAIGSAIAFLAYLIFPYNRHGPSFHHMIGFLVLLIGAVWIIGGLIQLFQNKKDLVNLGSLLINVIVIIAAVIYFYPIINHKPEMSSGRDDLTDSFWIVNDKGDTLYLKVGDSVRINKLK